MASLALCRASATLTLSPTRPTSRAFSSRTPTAFASVHASLFPQKLRSQRHEPAPSRTRKLSSTVMATVVSPTPLPPQQFDQMQKEEEIVEDEGEAAFVWRDHWYPVSLIEDLDPTVATAFQLLGRELVVWKDGGGEWRVFLDKCPHRLAPLSEGRLDESGMLQCSYHGWSFKGDGSCGAIPQAATSGPEAKAKFSPRACAVAYPTQVSQGLLFVWPDEKGGEKASRTPPPMLPPEFSDPKYSTVTIQRDLYYGYDTLMENVSDPSHIDFAHHKVTGRRDRAKPLPFKVEKSGPWGFAGANNDSPTISSGFYPPCYYYNKITLPVFTIPLLGPQAWEILICSFNIPMAPGKTRSIVLSARNFFRFSMPGPHWWQLVPRWYEHWTSNQVYDGDMIVLQGQEKYFQANDVNSHYNQLTFTPTQADRFVLAFRSWLRKHGQGGPDWFPEAKAGKDKMATLPSTVMSKQQMLDRYEQHTLKCASCRKALKGFRLWQKMLWGGAVVLAAGAGVPAEIAVRVVVAAASVASAAGAFLLKEGEKNFVYKDYVHSEIE